MPTRVGSAGLKQISSAKVYDPVSGESYVIRKKGTQAECDAEYASLKGTGPRLQIEPIEGTGQAILSIIEQGDGEGSPDDVVVTKWNLVPGVEEVSGWTHPKVTQWTNQMTPDGLATFRSDVAGLIAGTPFPVSNFSGLPEDLQAFVLALARGHENYITFPYTLRKTKTVSYASAITAEHDGVGFGFTTSQLYGLAEPPPAGLLGALPTYYWLKTSPGVEDMSDGRFQITVEWQGHKDGSLDSFYYS